MNIELHGLTPKQKAFADIMWSLDTKDRVLNFISTLPESDQRDCYTIIELMRLAFADEIQDVTEARDLLAQF